MLTTPEKIIFFVLSLAALYFAIVSIQRIARLIRRGQGNVDWKIVPKRLIATLAKVISMQPTYRIRLGPSILHAFIAWAFIYYLLVNLIDILEGFFPSFQFFSLGNLSGIYRLIADLLSVAALTAMVFFLVRRFIIKTPQLRTRPEVFLDPAARRGILRDSAIVGGFILIHIGSRFLGESFAIAAEGGDPWQPFASWIARLWSGWSDAALVAAMHVTFWLALGTILAVHSLFSVFETCSSLRCAAEFSAQTRTALDG